MSQEKKTGEQGTHAAEPEKEFVGDTLRKERITRRISVETIAKDLKLNVKYIKALESNGYDDLPADPYVRVYLKSLAKYLSLDTDAILKRFYEERGMTVERSPRENAQRITISVQQKEESHQPMIILVTVLVLLLAAFFFFAKEKGWLVPPPDTSSQLSGSADVEFAESEANGDSALADSLIPAMPPDPSDSGVSEIVQISAPVNVASGKENTLKVTVVSDSVWIQVFSDGTSWRNIVFKKQSRDFVASDSFNVHVGDLSRVKFHFNGKRVFVAGRGVAALKVDRKGKVAKWRLSKWNKVFNGRL